MNMMMVLGCEDGVWIHQGWSLGMYVEIGHAWLMMNFVTELLKWNE